MARLQRSTSQIVIAAITAQVLLVLYHQITTWIDFYPFNGARHYSRTEKMAEAGANAVLMSLAPIGFIFRIRGLMTYGVVYYFVLFGIELLIWWVPYFVSPTGRCRLVYNRLLAVATSNFEGGDTLDRWQTTYERLHRSTVTILPHRPGRPVPNLEHMILHAWTLLTALVTLIAYRTGA